MILFSATFELMRALIPNDFVYALFCFVSVCALSFLILSLVLTIIRIIDYILGAIPFV